MQLLHHACALKLLLSYSFSLQFKLPDPEETGGRPIMRYLALVARPGAGADDTPAAVGFRVGCALFGGIYGHTHGCWSAIAMLVAAAL